MGNQSSSVRPDNGAPAPPPPPPPSLPKTSSRLQQQNDGSHNHHNNGPCNCFFLDGLSKVMKKVTAVGSSDPIGSPLPETPVFQREKRQQVQAAMRQKQQQNGGARPAPVFSSQYNGLERETSNMFLNVNGRGISNTPSTGDDSAMDDEPEAQIHEGPDSELLLHAKYQIQQVLGVGSTSTVHKCVCKQTGESFACKIIDCQSLQDRFQGMMEQFQTEIEALRRLRHPGIIRLYDVYVTPSKKIYIIMELMLGGELFDYVVQKGTLTEQEAAGIVRTVTAALVYMHSNHICHRDLKPENLLLKHKPMRTTASPLGSPLSTCSSNSSNRQQASPTTTTSSSPASSTAKKSAAATTNQAPVQVKIIDFGLSKAMEEPVARTFLGTRGYLAPEMLQRRDYTRAVDTWALGVIVFVLLCGCLPFDDDSSAVPSDDLVKARFVLRFPRWAKHLSDSAKHLLRHLLDVNPKTRYTAEQALDHPWVRGETAGSTVPLQSPGRIKNSPKLASPGRAHIKNGSNGTSYQHSKNYAAAGQRYHPPRNRRQQQAAAASPGTPRGKQVRKKSI